VNFTVLEGRPTNCKVSSSSKGSQKEHAPWSSELDDVRHLGTERSPTRSPTFFRTHHPSNFFVLDNILIEIPDSGPTSLGYRSAERSIYREMELTSEKRSSRLDFWSAGFRDKAHKRKIRRCHC
jgi:hypothetical protein